MPVGLALDGQAFAGFPGELVLQLTVLLSCWVLLPFCKLPRPRGHVLQLLHAEENSRLGMHRSNLHRPEPPF